MLSVSKVKNTAQAASYYNSPDQYYDKDSGGVTSRWGGKGAEILGLEGEVGSDDFNRLLEGRISPEVQLGKISDGGVIEHVPAWDLTFSAPKSLSIIALVGGDSRLAEAHIKASQEAMRYIEKEYALTRVSNNGKAEYTKVDNLVYASYVHTESRKHDPQLHTHNVVMNAVSDQDGQWRSLETLKMYEHQLMGGLVYRSVLANLTKKLGYDIEITDHDKGLWDIKGVPEGLMSEFSKRRKEVLATAQQRGLFDSKSMEKAALFSRDSKTHLDPEDLHKLWNQTVIDSGANLEDVISRSHSQVKDRLDKNVSARVVVDSPSKSNPSAVIKNDSISVKNSRINEPVPKSPDPLHLNGHVTPEEHPIDSQPVLQAAPPINLSETASPTMGQDKSGPLHDKSTIDGGSPIHITDPEIAAATDAQVHEFLSDDNHSPADIKQIIDDVRLSYRVLAADEAVFLESDVIKGATKLLMGNSMPGDVEQVLRAMTNTGELLPRHSRTGNFEGAFTTPAAFEKERNMVYKMLNGKDSRQAVGDKEGIFAFIASFETDKSKEIGSQFAFSEDQRAAIADAATSKDLVAAIQGSAGTGKTTLLECLIAYGQTKGFKFLGFAPTGSASETLAAETGINTRTVDSFLYTRKQGEVSTKEVWLVDEANMVGASNLAAMIEHAERSDAKLLLLGDKKQMEAVDWGRPFAVLQGFKMATSHVTKIIRQKNELLLGAVYDSLDRNFSSAFNRLRDSVFDIEKHDIVEDYLNLSELERSKTLVIIPDNEGRQQFNSEVHDQLIQRGLLSADEIRVRGLISANLNEAERTDNRFYKPGHIIEFQQDRGEFKAGEFWRVIGKDKKNLVLVDDNGQSRKFDPSELPHGSKFAIDVFKEEELKFSEGEKVGFSKSRKNLSVRNGDEFNITKINHASKEFTLTNEAGKSITLDIDKLHNLSHTYAMTSYKAEGKTVDRVMAKLESWRRNLVNERSFYVALSRARLDARLYVDNVRGVVKALAKHDANKTTSLTGLSHGDVRRAAEYSAQDKTDTKQLHMDLNLATQKLANRHGVFSHTALLSETLKSTLGTYDVRNVEQAIYTMRSRGELGLSHINHDKPNSENFYTMPTNIRQEAQIVRHMLQGKDRLPAIAGKSVINRYLAAKNERAIQGHDEPVSEATKVALLTILTSRDESILITGGDHSGHRDVMRQLGSTIAQSRGYRVRGFSTTSDGVKQLKDTMKSAGNIYAHIEQMEKRVAAKQTLHSDKELWVVENVSQIGAENLLRLQQVARYAGARMVLVADRQENSMSWGNIPTLLSEQGITNVNFDRSVKSFNPEINEATEKLTQGKITEALSHVSPMVSEIRDNDNPANDKKVRLEVLASSYLNLSPEDREKTAVIIPDYFSRNKVDVQIRNGLQKQGLLTGAELTSGLYRNANLDPFEKQTATNYKVGQVVMFESNRPGIEKGGYYNVSHINKTTNELTLISTTDGKHALINASEIAGSRNNSVQVFHVENKSIQVGEKLRFTRSVPSDSLVAGDGKSVPSKASAVVESIDGTNLALRLGNGRQVTVDTDKWKHLEWGYTHNLFNIKDKQFENVIALMESWKKHFATQEVLHNALTKTSVNLRIVTDDKPKLLESLSMSSGFRQTALQDRQVSINKAEMASFDKQFGVGLSFASRGLIRLESAVDKAVTATQSKFMEKTRQVGERVQAFNRQRTL